MSKIDVLNSRDLAEAAGKFLDEFPCDDICALQLWYEGLGGQGVPDAAEMAAIQDAIANKPGWMEIGSMMYEKFGMQNSYKRTARTTEMYAAGKIMVHHMYKKNGLYREPDGKLIRVCVPETWILRCFEVVDGKMTGPMIKISPESDRAKALVEVG